MMTWRSQERRNFKAGLKRKCTSKYLTQVNQRFLQDGFILIKISKANKPVKLDLMQEAFRIDACNISNDSPPCSKEAFRIAVVILASKLLDV